MMIHPVAALPLLLVGWIGFSMRRSALGGAVALLVAWQGLLAMGAIFVFHRESSVEGAVLLWVFSFCAGVSLLVLLALALRQYYGTKNMKWDENERIRH